MALELIDPYPWFLNKPLDLSVCDMLVRTRITATEWVEHWRPFLAKLLEIFLAKQPNRILIAIAGPPGAGKSVLAEQLHWLIERHFFHKEAHSVSLPMDGFHYSNAYLLANTRKLPDGTEIPLTSVKGSPDTFDVKAFRRHLQLVLARPESVPWPGYSRSSHDVVPDKHHVHESVNVVIVDGNYLLVDRGQYAGIPAMFDLKIYVETPAPQIIANLMERHINGGKSVDAAKDWVKRIDLPNARIAEGSKSTADVIIERDTDHDFSGVTWKGGETTKNRKGVVEPAAPPPAAPQREVG